MVVPTAPLPLRRRRSRTNCAIVPGIMAMMREQRQQLGPVGAFDRQGGQGPQVRAYAVVGHCGLRDASANICSAWATVTPPIVRRMASSKASLVSSANRVMA
jgi:hypothetical protein